MKFLHMNFGIFPFFCSWRLSYRKISSLSFYKMLLPARLSFLWQFLTTDLYCWVYKWNYSNLCTWSVLISSIYLIILSYVYWRSTMVFSSWILNIGAFYSSNLSEMLEKSKGNLRILRIPSDFCSSAKKKSFCRSL